MSTDTTLSRSKAMKLLEAVRAAFDAWWNSLPDSIPHVPMELAQLTWLAAYSAGQQSIRERAAKKCEYVGEQFCARQIRTLEVE